METINAKNLYEEGVIILSKNINKEEAKSILKIYFEDVLQITYLDIISNKKVIIDINKYEKDIEKLLNNYPVQYLAEKAFFLHSFFKVNKHTLIPRPETEELVLLVCKTLNKEKNNYIIDIGTGSGCIAISLKQIHPNWQLTGVDISEEALNIATYNSNNLKIKVEFKKNDILKFNTENYNFIYDCVVSNPPYILQKEKNEMLPNVLDYEPHSALFVEDKNPLIFYEKILEFNQKYLKTDGYVFFEINPMQSVEIEKLLHKFQYSNIKIVLDYNNKSRFAIAKKQ